MKVLGSVVSPDEARTLIDLGIDIIDVKNPNEGSLGAPPPWLIRQVAEYARVRGVPVSAALGDLAFQPGTAALAALGAAAVGADYVKAGLYGTRTVAEATELLVTVQESLRKLNGAAEQPMPGHSERSDESIESERLRFAQDDRSPAQALLPIHSATHRVLVAAGYADYRRFGGLRPQELIKAAARANCHWVMLDTAVKDGNSLFDALQWEEIDTFVRSAHACRLRVALAGSLRKTHFGLLGELKPDVIGVRSALCRTQTRTNGIDLETAQDFIRSSQGIPSPTAAS